MNDVGVHDFPSFDAALGDLCPDGVSISGVDTLGVAGIDISSVSGLSSIMYITPHVSFCWVWRVIPVDQVDLHQHDFVGIIYHNTLLCCFVANDFL